MRKTQQINFLKIIFDKVKDGIRHNGIFYLTGFLVILGLKFFYSRASSDELVWILGPTARWVTILSGIPFVYVPGMGYVNHDLLFLIAPSCSGVQFMLITIATLLFSFVHRPASFRGKLCWTLSGICASYLLTVFVNGLRIILAYYIPLCLENAGIYIPSLTPAKLHTIIGTMVYFLSLFVIYQLAGFISLKIIPLADPVPDSRSQLNLYSGSGPELTSDPGINSDSGLDSDSGLSSSLELTSDSGLDSDPGLTSGTKLDSGFRRQFLQILYKCAVPAFWYFFLVLGVPLFNRALQKNGEQFVSYAALIISVCLALLCLTVPALLCLSVLKRKLNRDTSKT